MTRREQARIEQVVQRVRHAGGEVYPLSRVVDNQDVIRLLQHERVKERARVRRMVRQALRYRQGSMVMLPCNPVDDDGDWLHRETLLAALEGR